MTNSLPPSSPSVGRFTGPFLGLIVFVCVTMIGLAGYLKYELDRAETALTAPEATLSGDQEVIEKLRRSLGYSGFIGPAQTFAATHDTAALPDMKAQLKTANDMVVRLPEKTSAETRHDLQAIVTTFGMVLQKAEKSTTDPATNFTVTDLTPLYAALPVLDARLTSASNTNRLAAHNQLQVWAMLLTLVSWCSLIIAAAMSAGVYLTLRGRHSAPMRALTQSVKNMARGDMRTSIWGMERQDAIGDLARTVDLARYHFSQLPDMSLLSEQGPVRIRFEGNTRSLFEAMMQLITRDSEQVRQQATSLTDTINKQQEAIAQISTSVESVLHNILQRGQDGSQQVKHVLEDILGGAQSLKNAQEHAADQLNRIVPYLQERAQGLSEITQLTGKQVAQALHSLNLSERSLKSSAEQSDAAIKKFSTTADDLGGRLFGAVNLLQASGKVLSETTESTQSRLNDAIERLNQSLQQPTVAADYIKQIEQLIASLQAAQFKLAGHVEEQTKAAQAQIELLTTHSNSLLSQSTTTAQTLSSAADNLREEESRFDETIGQISTKLDEFGTRLVEHANDVFGKTQSVTEQNRDQLNELVRQVGNMTDKLASLSQATETSAREPAFANNLLVEIKTGFETTVRSLSQMREQLTNMVINIQTDVAQTRPTAPVVMEASTEQWQKLTAHIDATRTNLTQLITQQIDRLETRITSLNNEAKPEAPTIARDTQEQMEQQTQILTELVATLGVLDAHMQEIRSQVSGIRPQKAG